MKFISHKSLVFVLALSINASACASARYDKLPFSGKSQITDKVKILLLEPETDSGVSSYSNTTEKQWLWDILERTASCAYQSTQSPLSNETGKDIHPNKIAAIYVEQTTERSEFGYAILLLGGFAIPSRLEKTSLTIETRFQNIQGEELGTITEVEQLSTWGGLLLVFGMPFTRSFRNLAGDALYSAHHRTISQAVARGYLAGSPATQPGVLTPLPIEPSGPPG